MRVLCRNLPPLLRVCVAPVEDAHANGTADSSPDSPNKDSRRWPQLVSPRRHRTEERTPLAGADAAVDREDPRASDDDDEDDDDDDDPGQTRFQGRDREALAHNEAVQQVACVLPFEEEAEVRAVREEEASFLAALGITDGGEEGEDADCEEGGEAGEVEGEEALEAEEAAIFAQMLHGSSDAPPPRSANGLPKARLQRARPCAAAIDVPAGMPAPSCPLLLSASQRQRRQLSLSKMTAAGVVEADMDSEEENEAGVAVAADVAVAGGATCTRRTVAQRWARTGTAGTESV